jgi:hypothetical protein
MFCCFRKLAGMRSFPACDPKIASEYLPLCQTPNTSPFCKGGRGDFTDRPKKTPNISPFIKGGRGDFHSREVMVETEAVMEKIYRVIEIPHDPPFSKGGNVLLFSETCRHPILSGMRSENSLGISPPFAKSRTPPPFSKGGLGGI